MPSVVVIPWAVRGAALVATVVAYRINGIGFVEFEINMSSTSGTSTPANVGFCFVATAARQSRAGASRT
jgi:hypothetical protein